jgi:hypothetical protein
MKRPELLLGGLALILAIPGLANGFAYDDVPAILDNPIVHSLGNSPRIWVSPYWSLGLLYRPLTVQLFAIEWWLGGGSPFAFHAVNALLYAIVTVFVVRIGRRLLATPGALAAGLVFVVHPVHAEVVANAVGQSELLATLFILLAADRYFTWRDTLEGFTGGRRAALVGCYLLAIASKETGYVLPVLLLVAGVICSDKALAWRQRVREAAPLILLLGCVGVAGLLLRWLFFGTLSGEIAQVPLRGAGFGDRAVAMLAVVPEWARLLLWPAHLQAHYGPPDLPVTTTLTPHHAAGLAVLVVTGAVLVWTANRAPLLALSIAWIVIGLAPVSNVLTATGVLLAERTLFLPSVGFALGAGWGARELAHRFRQRRTATAAFASAGILILALGAWRSVERSRAWTSQDAFFARLEQDAGGSYRAQLSTGIFYSARRRYPDAERAFHRAWSLYRNDPSVFEQYGQLYRIQGRCDLALPIFEEGVLRHPETTVVRARLIECALAVGDTTRARVLAREAVARGQPEFGSTLTRLAPR